MCFVFKKLFFWPSYWLVWHWILAHIFGIDLAQPHMALWHMALCLWAKKKQQAVAHPVYYTKIHYTTLHHTLLHYFTTLHNYHIHTHHPTLSCMDTSCFFRTVLVNTLLSQLSHQFVMFGWYVFIDNGFSVNFIITMVTYTSHA